MLSSVEHIHICSLVVHCFPEKLDSIKCAVLTINNLDLAASDSSGKLVVVLETETEQEILSVIDQIQNIVGVLTATMVYHQLDC